MALKNSKWLDFLKGKKDAEDFLEIAKPNNSGDIEAIYSEIKYDTARIVEKGDKQ